MVCKFSWSGLLRHKNYLIYKKVQFILKKKNFLHFQQALIIFLYWSCKSLSSSLSIRRSHTHKMQIIDSRTRAIWRENLMEMIIMNGWMERKKSWRLSELRVWETQRLPFDVCKVLHEFFFLWINEKLASNERRLVGYMV